MSLPVPTLPPPKLRKDWPQAKGGSGPLSLWLPCQSPRGGRKEGKCPTTWHRAHHPAPAPPPRRPLIASFTHAGSSTTRNRAQLNTEVPHGGFTELTPLLCLAGCSAWASSEGRATWWLLIDRSTSTRDGVAAGPWNTGHAPRALAGIAR